MARSRDADGRYGRAIALEGVESTLTRVLVEDSADVGIELSDYSIVAAEQVTVRRTRSAACAATACADAPGGHGIGVYYDARLTLTGFEIDDSAFCGIHIAGGGQADLSMGAVSHSVIGACIQTPGFDVTRLTHDVAYRDNDTNLDTTTLPVPDALGP